jgi:hypothetical protein
VAKARSGKAKKAESKEKSFKLNPRPMHVLAVLLVVGLAIKFYPAATHEFPVNFDSIYHARIGQIVADTGWVPADDPAAGGRPHLYPPLYHLLLGYASMALGIPAIELVKYILPAVSVLLIFTVFFMVRKHSGDNVALWAAAFTLFNPIIAAQSYDSPQLFGLLLFPVIAHLFLKGNYQISGLLLGACVLFNYSAAMAVAAVMILYSLMKMKAGDKKPLLRTGLAGAVAFGISSIWLFVSASRAGECLDLTTGVSTLIGLGFLNILAAVPLVAIWAFFVFYALRDKNDDYTLFWKAAAGIGVAGFIASMFEPRLHPYDQLLLFGLALGILLAEMRMRLRYNMIIAALGIALTLLVVSYVSPTLSDGDLAAARWVVANYKGGSVLANPEISGAINTLAAPEKVAVRTEFDLFLECIPDSERWKGTYEALSTGDIARAEGIMDQYGINYIVVGARDVWNYGFDAGKFDKMPQLRKVFSSEGTSVYARANTPWGYPKSLSDSL